MKSKKIYLSALILGLMGGISSAHSAFERGFWVEEGASRDSEHLGKGVGLDELRLGENTSVDRFYMWELGLDNVVGKIRTHSSATRVHTLDELKTLPYNPEHKDQKLRVGTNSVDLKNALISHGAVESENGKDVLITQEKLKEFLKSASSEVSKELIRVTPAVKRENGK